MSFERIYREDVVMTDAKTATSGQGFVGWRCPSNIALVKYWGKYKGQIPANPSISFSLAHAVTQTTIDYKISRDAPTISFYFGGVRNLPFEKKIIKYLNTLKPYFPFLSNVSMIISSHNSFPHSAGIASSASAMGALALCLCAMEKLLKKDTSPDNSTFFQKASFMARLGSGSASRSLFGGFSLWGEHEAVEGSSNEVAIPLPVKVHERFTTLKDAILLVDSGEKKISSSRGHAFMNQHPYAKQRFSEARKNITGLLDILQRGDTRAFYRLVEHEALSLHAMMMTSDPGYILLKRDTIEIIQKVTKYRESFGIPFCFTLDAGANVHILYDSDHEERVEDVINQEFKKHCEQEQVIFDQIGNGPRPLNQQS